MADTPTIGLKFCLDRSDILTTRLRGLVEDSRETETLPINSASGNWNISQVTNLFDGNWHTVMFAWACDDTTSFYDMGAGGTSALRKGICVVDGQIIGNEAVGWRGKSTPLEFIWNNVDSTFLGIGALMSGIAATSETAFTGVTEPASMIVKRLCIWDRPLGPDTSTNMGITNGFDVPNGRELDMATPAFWNWSLDDNLPSLWDSLTGSDFKQLSGNVVAYYKFNEYSDGSISGKDSAGFAYNTSTSGIQTSPSEGNTIHWHDALIVTGNYQLQDIPDPNEDGVMKTGLIAFEDVDGIKRRVGFINYDYGLVVLDGEYSPDGITHVPFLRSIGSSGMNFAQSSSASNFWVKSLTFTSEEFSESMILNLTSAGPEMNKTENPTGIEQTTGGQLLIPNTTWPQSVGLYNDYNELVAVAKFSSPIRKDEDHNVLAQVKLDFSGTYPQGNLIVPTT